MGTAFQFLHSALGVGTAPCLEILGIYWDDGKEMATTTLGSDIDIGTHWGNIRAILGLYGDNGKENGTNVGLRVYRV